jgi:tetratricopeptide (TPR) repeat protein
MVCPLLASGQQFRLRLAHELNLPLLPSASKKWRWASALVFHFSHLQLWSALEDWPMQARLPTGPLTRIPATGPTYRACGRWLVTTLLCLVPMSAGCQTDQHERFLNYSNEGVRLFQCGEYGSAREHFEVALSLEPKDVNLLYDIGQCYDRLGQYDKAQNFYQQCLTSTPNHAECRHATAVLLYRNGRGAEADQMIQTWLASQPQLGAAYAEEGWRLRQSGDIPQAIGRYQQALQYDPKNVRALTELGQVYEQQDHPDYALALYTRALEINPQQPHVASRINELRAKNVRKPLPD